MSATRLRPQAVTSLRRQGFRDPGAGPRGDTCAGGDLDTRAGAQKPQPLINLNEGTGGGGSGLARRGTGCTHAGTGHTGHVSRVTARHFRSFVSVAQALSAPQGSSRRDTLAPLTRFFFTFEPMARLPGHASYKLAQTPDCTSRARAPNTVAFVGGSGVMRMTAWNTTCPPWRHGDQLALTFARGRAYTARPLRSLCRWYRIAQGRGRSILSKKKANDSHIKSAMAVLGVLSMAPMS